MNVVSQEGISYVMPSSRDGKNSKLSGQTYADISEKTISQLAVSIIFRKHEDMGKKVVGGH